MKVLNFIKDIIRKYPRQFITSVVLLLFLSIIEMGNIVMTAPLVDFITKPNLAGASGITIHIMKMLEHFNLPASIYSIMILIFCFALLKMGFSIMVNYSVLKIKYLLVKDVIGATYKEFFNAGWNFFIDNSQGLLGNTIVREINKIGDSFGSLANVFAKFFQVLFCIALPFFISWQLSLAIILMGFVISVPFSMLGKISNKLGKINVETANKIYSVIQETLGASKVILGYGEQSKSVRTLEQVVDVHIGTTIKSQLLSTATPIVFQLFSLGLLLISILLSRQIFHIPLANLVIVLFSFYSAMPLIGQVIAQKNELHNFFPSYDQVNHLRQLARKGVQPSGDTIFKGFSDKIIFNHVNFNYKDKKFHLYDINIEIPKGKMISFVGRSGGGKSTLVDILLGFYSPVTGSVLIDGTDLKMFDILSWRHKIGYVPQDCVLFNISIRDNLKWAADEATDGDIDNACKMANADEFIRNLPKGLDTVVGDRGVRLSGGQRQRIALARAIIRKPEILILDEATSSLDSHSEKLIQEAIEKVAQQTTVIIIAHRLSTIINCDNIYVVDNGSIVESGKYEDLKSRNGKFSELAGIQNIT